MAADGPVLESDRKLDATDQYTVYVCATLLDLTSVNSREQTWGGDVRLEFAFAAPAEVAAALPADEFAAVTPSSTISDRLFWPMLTNARQLDSLEVWLSVGPAVPPGVAAPVLALAGDPLGKLFTPLSLNMRVRGVFNQRFSSLSDFPLDTELLQLRIALEKGNARFATRAETAEVYPAGHTVLVEAATCSTLDEWRLGTTFGSVTSQSAARRSRTGKRYSQWTGLLLVQRKAGHYLIGISAPFLLQSAGMVLLFLDGSFAQRLSAGTALIMTSRAMMETMQEALPQRDGFNLTLLERHFSANMLLMLIGMAMAACSAYAPPSIMAAVCWLARCIAAAAAAAASVRPAFAAAAGASDSVLLAASTSAPAGLLQTATGYALNLLPGVVPSAAELVAATDASAVQPSPEAAARLATATDSFLAWMCVLLWLIVNGLFAISALRLALLGRPLRWGREASCCFISRATQNHIRSLSCCRRVRHGCRAVFPSAAGASACGRQRVFVDDDGEQANEGRTFLEDLPDMFEGADPAGVSSLAAAVAWNRLPSRGRLDSAAGRTHHDNAHAHAHARRIAKAATVGTVSALSPSTGSAPSPCSSPSVAQPPTVAASAGHTATTEQVLRAVDAGQSASAGGDVEPQPAPLPRSRRRASVGAPRRRPVKD